MIPINNSDTAWLIVSDYNQDNGKYHEELREDVLDPDVSQWHYTYRRAGEGVGPNMGKDAGSEYWDILGVEFREVGIPMFFTGIFEVGEINDGQFVGGMVGI
jgi:hypothetical protein